MINTIRLADGTILDKSSAGQEDDILWVYVYTIMPLQEAYGIFSNPEKTATITEIRKTGEIQYQGFTDLFSIRKEVGDNIIVGLRITD